MNGNIGNMGDMGSMLSKLLEDPESLGKVMSIASTLSASGALNGISFGSSGEKDGHESRKTLQNEERSQETLRREPSQNDGREKQNYPDTKYAENSGRKHTSSGNKIKSCDRIRLLEAMRPFLSEDKRDKLEVVIKILGLADAAGGLHGIRR